MHRHCIGKFRECSECYACDEGVRRVCELYKEALDDLRRAQNDITLAVDSLEKAANAMEWMNGR